MEDDQNGELGDKIKNIPEILEILGRLEVNLSDYTKEDQGNIIESMLEDMSDPRYRPKFLSQENPYSENNKDLVLRSTQFREYLSERGIEDLDDVKMNHATPLLSYLLGVRRGHVNDIKDKLKELGVFPESNPGSNYVSENK